MIPKGPVKEASEALTYALIGIFCFGIILGPIAISKGSKALNIINEDPGMKEGGRQPQGSSSVLLILYFLL